MDNPRKLYYKNVNRIITSWFHVFQKTRKKGPFGPLFARSGSTADSAYFNSVLDYGDLDVDFSQMVPAVQKHL